MSDQTAVRLAEPPCSMSAASAWIGRWLAAWEFTAKRVLKLSGAPPPEILFYDASCVYSTSAVSGLGLEVQRGPSLSGVELPWRTYAHGGTITLPDSSRRPVQLMALMALTALTAPKGDRGAFFVMAAPEFWARAGVDSDQFGRERLLTAVFLHEFAHTRQLQTMNEVIRPIDMAWAFPQELSDDVVQERFESDPVYVAAYNAERDLLYRAAAADSIPEVRALAAQALEMIRTRRARWFTGVDTVFAVLDDTFLGGGRSVGRLRVAVAPTRRRGRAESCGCGNAARPSLVGAGRGVRNVSGD